MTSMIYHKFFGYIVAIYTGTIKSILSQILLTPVFPQLQNLEHKAWMQNHFYSRGHPRKRGDLGRQGTHQRTLDPKSQNPKIPKPQTLSQRNCYVGTSQVHKNTPGPFHLKVKNPLCLRSLVHGWDRIRNVPFME